MSDTEHRTFAWMELLWLAFLGGLAVLQPIFEIHKQLTLLAIGLFQIFEHRLLGWVGFRRGRISSVLIKIGLGTLLVAHTGDINSSYYLIYYLPVTTAAMFFEAWGTLLATALASAAYCSFLVQAFWEYRIAVEVATNWTLPMGSVLRGFWEERLGAEGATELALRNLFFFLAAIVVNRFVTENRRQSERYQNLALALAETNRRLEQAQAEARRSERLAALGQLSAGLAHELRNPLGVIKGSAETLSKKLASSDAVTGELAGYISSEVDRLNMIVSRFLDFARPQRLNTRLEQLPPVVDRALKAVDDRWKEAKIRVERQYAPDLPAVPMDAELCEQVFTNLASNAYEAMGEEGGRLRVAIAETNSNGRRGVEVDFDDTGPGIPPELMEQIFNPFFTTKKSGVGLGLSIVAKIVDDHQGWIRAASPPKGKSKGACFKIFLPVEENGG